MGVEEGELQEVVDKPGTTTGTQIFRITLFSNTIFNEMWCLTVDPLT